ncbi:GNAT family N-acetyltransferase [Roseovarius arcticus]|uniref:GNAT family N-acetyltransferase n=1 Tax=Roseovarius arcticus TaxID=2547404 RepID=UPI00111079B3|nr:GNAT family N-acetyltransferase [Roseovarius arcticus]
MFHETARIQPGIRRLWKSDQPQLIDHFQRLDDETRRLRFGGMVSDGFVSEYAEQVLSTDAVIFGSFPDDELRGVAELRGLINSWPRNAEVALLVEPAWQDVGIGEALLSRLIAAAQNRGVKTLHMLCLRENMSMRSLAKKHSAHLEIDVGNVEATLAPSWPTPMSVFEEMFGDTRSYLDTLFHQPK